MSTAHKGTITVRLYMNKVTSLLFDQAVLQIVRVTLRRVCVCLLYRGMMGMPAAMRDCLFCDQHQ